MAEVIIDALNRNGCQQGQDWMGGAGYPGVVCIVGVY